MLATAKETRVRGSRDAAELFSLFNAFSGSHFNAKMSSQAGRKLCVGRRFSSGKADLCSALYTWSLRLRTG